MTAAPDLHDALVIGGGPAGLTAALYLARFRRRVVVVDKDEGRLALIPLSRNLAGFPQGVNGRDLLARMREQARLYGAELRTGEATQLRREGGGFLAATTTGEIFARAAILATGVVNTPPPLEPALHADAVARGLLRYCPICDAFEQTGKTIGVLGGDRHGLAEAMFLKTYAQDVRLIAPGAMDLDSHARMQAAKARITLVENGVAAFDVSGRAPVLTLRDGARLRLDTLYVGLGTRTRNELGRELGVDLVDGQCFAPDAFQRLNVPGLYAAGDAVEGLDQISTAIGTGARAAVSLHNDLRAAEGRTLRD